PVVRAADEPSDGPQVTRRKFPKTDTSSPSEPACFYLLVKNHCGYQNLCRLLSKAHAGLPKGQSLLEVDMLREHADGLLPIVPVGLASLGDELEHWFRPLVDAFGSTGAIAVYRRWDAFDQQRQERAVACSERLGFPIIASNRPSYHRPRRKPLADIVYCIRNGITLDEAGRRLEANAEAYSRSAAQTYKSFPHQPEQAHKSAELAAELTFDLGEIQYQFPCHLEPGETADQRLERLTWRATERRYPQGPSLKVRRQLEKELRLIARLNVASYFLCTWEIVEIARELRILCQGRGSAANSAVCYVLGITAV